MMTLSLNRRLEIYRERTFRTAPALRLNSFNDALQFVDQRGFLTLWPIKGIMLPSLWSATAGSRPVAAEHDDPGHITWRWKDQALSLRSWYYAKLLRGKATFVSLAVVPNFYALSPREADLDDFHQAYHAGLLSREALNIADVLLEDGAMDSVQLRRRANLSNAQSKSRFERGLTELQKGFWILPIGIAEAGSWRYAFIYELVDRWYPELPAQAGQISESEARKSIITIYLRSVGVSSPLEIRKVLGWRKSDIQKALVDAAQAGNVVEIEDGNWASSAFMLEQP